MSENSDTKVDTDLSKYLKDRIEKNRQRALTLRNAKLVHHPYAKGEIVSIDKTTIKIGATRYKDTGGGFLLEENPEQSEQDELSIVPPEAPPIVEPDRPECRDCHKLFATSWLFDNFGCKCCDECKESETYKLITKTEAKTKYLLQDCDLEKREPPLKFIKRKNPHNTHWGDMKLYLELQVESRAVEVWGSTEELEEEKDRREEKKVIAKNKKYNKKLKELRMSIRSSMYDRTSAGSHVHEFGVEIYNEEDDTYTRNCTTCPYVETFEKM
ncbi:DNA repair protein complementing XP-A cells homolog isoform X1 [Euwallacea fornicatus]|uniref:DNA repair protein complementing XP-A cells homolog isoform X1 n=1 Tax=Euwallacea fornicatus TaxID=995702 RepID=UPI00338D58F9